MTEIEMEIFEGGRRTDSSGTTRDWTEAELNQVAGGYDPAIHEAPVVVGHPQDDKPAYGWVTYLKRRGMKLLAGVKFVPAFMETVKRGLYKNRSASFYHPHDPRNPRPGAWYLRHVGFLGAMPPAIKGLAPVSFAAGHGAAHYEFSFNEALGFSGQSLAQRVKEYAIEHRVDVLKAFERIMEHPDHINFPVTEDSKSGFWGIFLHEIANIRARTHGVNYSEALKQVAKEKPKVVEYWISESC